MYHHWWINTPQKKKTTLQVKQLRFFHLLLCQYEAAYLQMSSNVWDLTPRMEKKKHACISPFHNGKVPHFTVSDLGSLAIDVGEFSSDRRPRTPKSGGCDLKLMPSIRKRKNIDTTPVSPGFWGFKMWICSEVLPKICDLNRISPPSLFHGEKKTY